MKKSLVAASLLLLGCASAENESWLVSEATEIEMGAEYHQQLQAEMPRYTGDARVDAYVQSLGQALVPLSSRPGLPWKFTVVQSDEVNAFAVLGGYVYVTTGLLRSASSGAEVATILAHEMGHVCARHGVRALETFLITQGLTDLLFQDGNTKDIVSGALGVVETLTFSQDQEREADALGVDYAAAGGWNPWGMVKFFDFLQGLEGGSEGGYLSTIGELFSTHPPTTERIENVSAQLNRMGIGEDAAGYRWGRVDEDASFAAMQAALGQ